MFKWRFPSNDYGENKGINDSGVAMFRGTPLKSLAREICQNSLDAAIKDKTIIEFNLFNIPSAQVPGRDVLLDTFNRCLKFWGSQTSSDTKDFFTDAINELAKDECTFLRISDFNTKGLLGSKEPINTDWTNLTKSAGASDKKGTAGGSFGIGKFAPFACSYLSTVFYSTYDMEGIRASQGVARLVTFTREDGQNTQGTGYFGDEKNTPMYEELILDPSFKRAQGEYGTDVYIAGYRFGNNWEKEIIPSIVNGFIGAIWNDLLEIRIGKIVINKDTLEEILDKYQDGIDEYTKGYYKVLKNEKTVWFTENFMGMGEIKLGLLLGEQDSTNRVAMIRQTGMKIMDKDRLPGIVPIMGVMFINGDEINTRLRKIENPEHTKWEPDRSKNPIIDKALVKSLNDFIKDRIVELVSQSSGESIDAVGVGNYLPDDPDDSKDKKTEEVISDTIVNVEIKSVKVKKDNQKQDEPDEDLPSDGHREPGGDDEEWFHDDGTIVNPNPPPRPPQPAHIEEGGEEVANRKFLVGTEKVVFLCVNKDKGQYMLAITPDADGVNGSISLYLSAETQKYEAPIRSVNMNGNTVDFTGNVCTGLVFTKGSQIRMKLELDYYDYCSIEVIMYATKK